MPEGQRRLAGIMFTDMVGYTALTQANEPLALTMLNKCHQLVGPIFAEFRGREVKSMGDAFLVEFDSALDATTCGIEIQKALHEYNSSSHDERQLQLRIGIHLGDVVHLDGDVLGDAVNIASRIEPLAEPGTICISEQVFAQVRNKITQSILRLGPKDLKNVQFPVEVYKIVMPWEEITASPDSLEKPAFTEDEARKLVATPSVSVSTGLPDLDKLLADGYPDKSAVLVIGPPGIGKEALGYWFTSTGLAKGDFCLYITRLSVREVLHDIKGFGVNLQQGLPLWLANGGGQIKYDVNNFETILPNLKELLKRNAGHQIRIVIDVLSSLLVLYQTERIYKFIAQLLDEVKRYDAVLLATLEEGMHKPEVLVAMQQLFDGVLELKLYEEGLRALPLLRIKKMRGVPTQPRYYNFEFTKVGMEVSPYAK